MLPEIYRTIKEFPLYEVSNYGSVRSWAHKNGKRKNHWKLKAEKMRNGAMLVRLNSTNPRLVHRLVLGAFVSNCPEGMECCHNDGNPGNNHVDNLRWDTHKRNMADKIKHGTIAQGEKHGMSKLNSVQVLEIKSLYKKGENSYKIGAKFNVDPNTIMSIVNNKTWRWLK